MNTDYSREASPMGINENELMPGQTESYNLCDSVLIEI